VSSLRVFISSTFEDLLDYRYAASDAIRGLDLQTDDMIVWSADSRSPVDVSVDRVKQSDVFILLVAHRYGTVPDGAEHGIVELEYLAAREAGIDVYAFLVDEKVDWPPAHIDESRGHVREFKARVQNEVTCKFFKTPHELALQVTQALAHHLTRPARPRPVVPRVTRTVRLVSSVSQLVSEPDVLVPIGTSEDGLPLLLEVIRSRDISYPFYRLRNAISGATSPALDELLDKVQGSVAAQAIHTWTGEDVHEVLLRDGRRRRLYVPPLMLRTTFTTIVSRFLSPATRLYSYLFKPTRIPGLDSRPRTLPETWRAPSSPGLQSQGGRNRFLAIDPEDGSTYTVGRREGQWVEWRPFLCECILPTLPEAEVEMGIISPRSLVGQAAQYFREQLSDQSTEDDGRLPCSSRLIVRRRALLSALADVADKLGALHARDVVHGDIKPDNVLLTESGVALIDSLDIRVGHQAPGWTPQWSAPEQALGQPITPAADIYPLAVMVVRALGGEIVGEVRKYLTPGNRWPSGTVEMFHNPSLYFAPQDPPFSREGLGAWRNLVDRSLNFAPDDRQTSAAGFAEELRAVMDEYPVSGTLGVDLTGDLLAVRFGDGTEAIARVVATPRPA
jgi:hypothetical protein